MIKNALYEELKKQEFSEPEALEDKNGEAVMFTSESVAYSLLYNKSMKRFELRTAELSDTGLPDKWRTLSMWLFDEDSTREDAQSIVNDFTEVVAGPKLTAAVQQKKKRSKDDERSVNPMFFMNRLVNIIPELKEELNNERIMYGQVRFVTFTKTVVVPECEKLITKSAQSANAKKLYTLLDDMYKDGDMDLRSLVTVALTNELSDDAFNILQENLGEDLKKSTKFTRKLKGKKIKPEKPKKQKKIEARLDTRS